MEVFFCIPSYRRHEKQTTLEMLERFSIPKERIIMSVQTEEDFQLYQKYRDRVQKLLYRPAENISGNRNTILAELQRGTKAIIFDDDIQDIYFLRYGKFEPLKSGEEFISFVRTGFSIAQKFHAPGFSVYPVCNDFFMSETFTKTNIAEGTLVGVTVTDIKYDETFHVKEDYEYSCHNIQRYGAYPRLNNFTCKAKHYSSGGCEQFWKDGKSNADCAIRLCKRYPQIVKLNKARPGEVKMAHTEKSIPYRWKCGGGQKA